MTKQPSYRFAGYTEPWTEKKLGEVLTERNIQMVPSDQVPLVSFTVENGVTPKTERYNREFLVREESKKYKYTRYNDIVYNPANLKFGAIARNKYGKAVFSPIYVTFEVNYSNILPEFIEGILTSKDFIQQALKFQEGTVYERMAVKADDFTRLAITVPSLPEQTAIGSFFQDIDQFISLQQRKLEVLKEQKKTYLKLLFPAKGQTKPALRFAGFEDDWKEVKLGGVLKKNNKKNRDLAINNVESVSNKLGFVKQTEQFGDYTVASADLSNYYVISEKQFAYNPSRINVGSIAYKKEGDTLSVVSPLYISFSTVENIDDSYLWYWFKTSLFDSQREIYSEGGVRDTLSFNQLSNIELIFPCFSEQEAIGFFFQDLDKAIAKQEEKVNQLKESKQTLLRKMFI